MIVLAVLFGVFVVGVVVVALLTARTRRAAGRLSAAVAHSAKKYRRLGTDVPGASQGGGAGM